MEEPTHNEITAMVFAARKGDLDSLYLHEPTHREITAMVFAARKGDPDSL